ncbi:Histidinol-phosphate aminotransferase [Flavobacteriaceae bacterium 3519-10]|nr:Histidinol-phosphate aminotransferase [Flavobacteriaceae bacterium 3519-10]
MEFNLEKMLRPHLKSALVYTNTRPTESSDGLIYLDSNESPVGKYNRYPDGEQKALKGKLAAINGVSADRLFMGNGSDELIDLLMRIFCEPGSDTIMCLDPSFSMYEVYADFNNLKIEKLRLNGSFQLDKEVFDQCVSETSAKILFICSPNNPTGNSIEDLAYFISKFEGLVVIDEAYIEFSPNDSATKLLVQFPNLVVLKTLSKAHGMAGLRLGVGFASPEIARLITRLKPPYNISSESQRIAAEELDDGMKFNKNVGLILSEKAKLVDALEQIRAVKKVYASHANFLLVEFADADEVYRILIKNQILTSLRHPGIPNCIRITVGNPEENLKLISILTKI